MVKTFLDENAQKSRDFLKTTTFWHRVNDVCRVERNNFVGGQKSKMANKCVILLFTVFLLLLLVYRLNVVMIREYTTIYQRRQMRMCQLALFDGYKRKRLTNKAR